MANKICIDKSNKLYERAREIIPCGTQTLAKGPTQYVNGVAPYDVNAKAGGSTDVGDVSYTVPTAGLRGATWVPGTPAHSWQAVAAGGTSIGIKGMMTAAKVLSLTGMQLLENPDIIKDIQQEFNSIRGEDFQYIPLLGDRSPALDYRN